MAVNGASGSGLAFSSALQGRSQDGSQGRRRGDGASVTPVRDMSCLRTRLGLLWPGDAAELEVLRNGKPAVVRATMMDPQRGRAQE
jgi:hypothetical protein